MKKERKKKKKKNTTIILKFHLTRVSSLDGTIFVNKIVDIEIYIIRKHFSNRNISFIFISFVVINIAIVIINIMVVIIVPWYNRDRDREGVRECVVFREPCSFT